MIGNHYEITIIPFDKKAEANIAADKNDGGKTSKTFTVPLWNEKGDVTKDLPTNLWYCWWMSDEKSAELKKDFDGDDKDKEGTKYKDKVFDLREGWTPESILKKMKLKVYDAPLIAEKPTEGIFATSLNWTKGIFTRILDWIMGN